MLAAPLAGMSYVWLAQGPLTYGRVLGGLLLAMTAYQTVIATTNALVTQVGQRDTITGELSALGEAAETTVSMVSALAGGWLASHANLYTAFWIGAAISAAILAQAFWRPAGVFAHKPSRPVRSSRVAGLFRDRGMRNAAIILVLYNFSPGWATPLLYYLTDRLGLSSQAFAACRAGQYGSVLAAAALYGFLCRRYPLKRLLHWALLVNVFSGFLFLLARGPLEAVAVSALVGLLVGFANVALFDLLMRCCPNGVEGSGTALGHSVFAAAGAGADLFGAWLYQGHGFAACLLADAVATALVFPLLRSLPIMTPDSQAEVAVAECV
jgi:hypothetical protein